jgi:hypothetical protein
VANSPCEPRLRLFRLKSNRGFDQSGTENIVLNLFTNLTCLAVGSYVVVMLVMLERRERRKRAFSEYRNIAERQSIDTTTKINYYIGRCR